MRIALAQTNLTVGDPGGAFGCFLTYGVAELRPDQKRSPIAQRFFE